MNKTLYHGSERIIERPEFGVGNHKNDYGLGFYCTEHLDLAKEWASSETKDGFVNQYSIDLDNLKVLNLNDKDYSILNWLAILLENRTFDLKTPVSLQAREYLLKNYLPDYKSCDVIIGYRADDSYFSFSRAFLENGISLSQLQKAMYLGKLGEQVVLKSKEVFEQIKFAKYIPTDSEVYYPRKMARDRQAREAYFKMLEDTAETGAVYMIDLIRQNNASL